MISSLTLSHASPYPPSWLPKVLWHKWASQAREPFSICLVSERIPSCRYSSSCLYLVSANVQSCRWSYFLNIFPAAVFLSLCLAAFFVSLGCVSLFLWHLLCGSDYALHLSVLSCFRFLSELKAGSWSSAVHSGRVDFSVVGNVFINDRFHMNPSRVRV